VALWTPEEINTEIWYDAADSGTIIQSSGAVSSWLDKSGNNKHANQTTEANKPATNTVTIGGLNTIEFDGVNDYLTLSSVYSLVNDMTIVNVFSRPSDLIVSQIFGEIFGDYRTSLLWDSDDNYYTKTDSAIDFHDFNIEFGSFLTATVIRGTSARVDFFGSNGITINTGETPSSTFSVIGRTLTSLFYHQGAIGEALIINGAIVQDDIDIVVGYMAWKWGLESRLPPGHPYKDSPPESAAGDIIGTLRKTIRKTVTKTVI